MHENIQDSNQRLARHRRAARKRLAKIRAANGGIARRNAEQPSKAPLPLHPEPYVPRLAPSGLDLSATIAEFGALTPQALTVVETVDALTNLGPEKGFSNEDLTPMYHLYRGLSARGIHPSFAVYESYLLHGHFVRTAPDLGPPAMTSAIWESVLYMTAFLAGRLLTDNGHPTPIADALCERLAPEPDGSAAWRSR